MYLRILAAVGVASLVTATAAVAGNTAIINQNGVYNGAYTGQRGQSNTAITYQNGTFNGAGIRQRGPDNAAGISQYGYSNGARVIQTGPRPSYMP
ncbi:hypothetical protein DA075_23405 [Methylobacterium currus]|jgi:minor curlin subunit|uniref:Curlin n=1 Tax=Methylobacterium currus TaxID=2051553 RepID=A0A2R4WPP0_9HYPH|nr:hypothetical protein [Methylobacterium currus]AWB23478.1 hypothetical protein DA075_23405 [Methylobacterium currus]UHC16872.1 hypothetical protein LRS73_02820 [Methylobacterium currus]